MDQSLEHPRNEVNAIQVFYINVRVVMIKVISKIKNAIRMEPLERVLINFEK